MRRPPSTSRDPATPSCPSGPESPWPAAAPGRRPAEESGPWSASARGAEVPVVTVAGTDTKAGGVAWSWSAVATGADVGRAGTSACCPWDGVGDGIWEGACGGAAPDGGGAELPGTVGVGVGEADGGRGFGRAGQNFAGRRPAGPQGSAIAGSARTRGDAPSTSATADAKQAFRMEFILTIVGLCRRQAGNPGPVRLLFPNKKGTPSRGRRPARSSASPGGDFDSGDRPSPGAGRVLTGHLGTDVPLLQLDDLRLGSRAIDLEHHVLRSGLRILGEVDLGMGDAHTRRGDSVWTSSHHFRDFTEAAPWPVGRAGVGKEQ